MADHITSSVLANKFTVPYKVFKHRNSVLNTHPEQGHYLAFRQNEQLHQDISITWL